MVEPCILSGSKVNDVVLDPFMGSGTTAMVAKSLNRNYLGCELHNNYSELIEKRINSVPVNKPAQDKSNPLEDLLYYRSKEVSNP